MRVNSRMRSLVDQMGTDPVGLPDELTEILEAGWFISDCGALLLSGVGAHATSWPCSSDDVSGREYEVNEVKVPDLDLGEAGVPFLREVTRRAVGFAKAALVRAAGIDESSTLICMVSVEVSPEFIDSGASVRFFTRRGGHPDWYEDIERFETEAIMLLEVADAAA